MRLIDADNLISLCEIMDEKCGGDSVWANFIDVINDVPTIDPHSIKHIENAHICTRCGEVIVGDISCPNCGTIVEE